MGTGDAGYGMCSPYSACAPRSQQDSIKANADSEFKGFSGTINCFDRQSPQKNLRATRSRSSRRISSAAREEAHNYRRFGFDPIQDPNCNVDHSDNADDLENGNINEEIDQEISDQLVVRPVNQLTSKLYDAEDSENEEDSVICTSASYTAEDVFADFNLKIELQTQFGSSDEELRKELQQRDSFSEQSTPREAEITNAFETNTRSTVLQLHERPPTDTTLEQTLQRVQAEAETLESSSDAIQESSPETSQITHERQHSSIFCQMVTEELPKIVPDPMEGQITLTQLGINMPTAKSSRPQDYQMFYVPILNPKKGRPSTPEEVARQRPPSPRILQ